MLRSPWSAEAGYRCAGKVVHGFHGLQSTEAWTRHDTCMAEHIVCRHPCHRKARRHPQKQPGQHVCHCGARDCHLLLAHQGCDLSNLLCYRVRRRQLAEQRLQACQDVLCTLLHSRSAHQGHGSAHFMLCRQMLHRNSSSPVLCSEPAGIELANSAECT